MRSVKLESALTRERILGAAEEVLRRFGPEKATVVDVARALGVSHGSVYKHFESKAELRDAVLRVWLERVDDELGSVLTVEQTADRKLRMWLDKLVAIKRSRAFDDPELFATYNELADQSRVVVSEHIDTMVSQLESIIQAGVNSGDFFVAGARSAARAVLSATARFHHPSHANEWTSPDIDTDYECVLALVLSAMKNKSTD
jgi:AcrR family transcriptional regulator